MRADATIVLSDAVVVAPGTVQFDTVKLQNPAKTGMWVDEIRMAITFTLGADQNAVYNGSPAARLGFRFRLGRVQLTKDYVAMGAIAPTDLARTGLWGVTPASQGSLAFTTWRFAKPLYVPPNEYLAADCNYIPEAAAASFPLTGAIARVTYIGRVLGSDTRPPTMLDVPWASSFRTTLLNGTDSLAVSSTNVDLCNPHKVPLNMERLGFALAQSAGNSAPIFYLRLTDRDGNAVIRDFTPHTLLFALGSPLWLGTTIPATIPGPGAAPLKGVLPPKSYLKADMTYENTQSNAGTNALLNLALVGNYSVPVSAIWNG